MSRAKHRTFVLELGIVAVVGGGIALGMAGCQRTSSEVLPNPGCVQDLTLDAVDASGTVVGASDAATPTVGADGGVIYAPCAVVTDDAEAPVVGFDAGATPVICPSYSCVCDDGTTQSTTEMDSAGNCVGESQACTDACSPHNGWM